MGKIIRSVFIAISDTDKQGKVSLKANRQNITKVDLDEYIGDYRWKVMDSPEDNKQEQSVIEREEKVRTTSFPKVTTLQGRMDIQKFYAKEGRLDKPEGGSYPMGEKMRNREKASLSSYMVGGFEIVDYSDSINQLHKKLLSKILLNR